MWFRKLLLAIPTTKARIVVSILLTVWTAYHVLVLHWTPNAEWLVFLAANSGIDITQYYVNKASRTADDVTATTDVSEGEKG